MNSQDQVARLEALLARVTTRRAAPRPAAEAELRDDGIVPAAARVEAPTTPPPPAPPPTPTPAPVTAAAPAALIPPNVMSKATVRVSERPPAADADVEVEEGMAEVDLEGLDDGAALSDSVADLDAAAGPTADDELPASSRRPIQIQAQLERLDAAAEDKAPHPPPPESGRQVAAASDFEGDLLKSGVRAMPEELAPVTPPVAVAQPAAELKADVTRPQVATGSPAVFRGAAPEARPQTFGELLDSTLAL